MRGLGWTILGGVIGVLSLPALADDPPPTPAPAEALPTVDELLQKAEASMAKVQDYTAEMIKQERFKEGLHPQETMQVKFARPFKVYIKYGTPHIGREIIFVKGWNDNEIKVHKGSFPDLTVNLDPRGDMAMESNHHAVLDFGLENTIRVAAKNLRLAQTRSEGTFKVSPGAEIGGRKTWRIEATFPKVGTQLEVKEDEDLWSIARRSGQDMYLILYVNKGIEDPDDPDEGDKIYVPRYYGSRAEFLLDQETSLPLKVTIWDWNGQVYESFEYHNVRLNAGLTARDFDPTNPAYKF
jgi:hypothetical protein